MEPSTVTKMALGCFGVALSYLIMAGAAWSAGAHSTTWWWLCLFRRHHLRRALRLPHRLIAGFEGRAGAHDLDDDGLVAQHQLRRQFRRRLARQLLELHGKGELFPYGRCRSGERRRGDLVLQPTAQRHPAGLARTRSPGSEGTRSDRSRRAVTSRPGRTLGDAEVIFAEDGGRRCGG